MPAPVKSNDPIPAGALSLSQGYERFYHATQTVVLWAGEAQTEAEWDKSWLAWNTARHEAELEFRKLLAVQTLKAYLRDPDSGELLQPANAELWTKKHNFGISGFSEDFVSPEDLIQPGPETLIKGKLRPVFFLESEWPINKYPALSRGEDAEADANKIIDDLPDRVVERRRVLIEPLRGKKLRAAFFALRAIHPHGPERKHSVKFLHSQVQKYLRKQPSFDDVDSVSEDTIKRLLDMR